MFSVNPPQRSSAMTLNSSKTVVLLQLVLFKAQHGEPFLGIWSFFGPCSVISSFFSSCSESRHLREPNRHLSSQTGTWKEKASKRWKPALNRGSRWAVPQVMLSFELSVEVISMRSLTEIFGWPIPRRLAWKNGVCWRCSTIRPLLWAHPKRQHGVHILHEAVLGRQIHTRCFGRRAWVHQNHAILCSCGADLYCFPQNHEIFQAPRSGRA